MTDATNATNATPDATDATDAPTALVFPTVPAFDRPAHADATDGAGNPSPTDSYTWQWRSATSTKKKNVVDADGTKKTVDVPEYPTDGRLYGCRGYVAIVRPSDENAETVAIALENDRSIARVEFAHASGATVEFVPVAHKTEFAPPAAPKKTRTVTKTIVGVTDDQRAVLVATYATADDATKTALAATFPFLVDADA